MEDRMPVELSFVTEQVISAIITIIMGLFAYAAFRLSCENKNYNKDRYDKDE